MFGRKSKKRFLQSLSSGVGRFYGSFRELLAQERRDRHTKRRQIFRARTAMGHLNMSPIPHTQHQGVGKNNLAFVVAANRNQYLAYHRDYSLEQAVDEAFFVDPD